MERMGTAHTHTHKHTHTPMTCQPPHLTRAGLTPTNISWKSEPEMERKGTANTHTHPLHANHLTSHAQAPHPQTSPGSQSLRWRGWAQHTCTHTHTHAHPLHANHLTSHAQAPHPQTSLACQSLKWRGWAQHTHTNTPLMC